MECPRPDEISREYFGVHICKDNVWDSLEWGVKDIQPLENQSKHFKMFEITSFEAIYFSNPTLMENIEARA